ncbi:MAG: integrin alpha, partial [Myxococcota bacterium]|nr:integrin alpha [Myxococcota bacterium]
MIRYDTLGRYPFRVWGTEWVVPHADVGGEATVQLWLVEGRDEAVVVLEDIEFGDSSVDGGAQAVVGAQGGATTGVVWSCSGGLEDGSSAWFGHQGSRPSAPSLVLADLANPWTGTDTYQYLARTLAAGDLDGDGVDELVIGNQDEDQAFVIQGAIDTVGGSVDVADTWILGDTTGTELSAGLALGDLDGDGLLDLALGAPKDDTAGIDFGAVHVVAGGSLPAELDLPTDADLVLTGPTGSTKPRAGAPVAIGDLDGDGYEDLLVGAPLDDVAAADAGAVYLWVGHAGVWGADESLDDADAVWTGSFAWDQAGQEVALGDMDGDGAEELLIGAPYADDGASNGGVAYLLAGGSWSGSQDLSSVCDAVVQGTSGDDRLGQVLSVADLDGDGAGDLLVGVPYADQGASDGGVLAWFSGASALAGMVTLGDADGMVYGTTTSANVGGSVTHRDMNLDGVEDLVVGAPNASSSASGGGVVAVFLEAPDGEVELEDADNIVAGSLSGEAAGTALVSMSDHQEDGYPDLAIGAPYAAPDTISLAGAVHVWSYVPSFLDADGDGVVAVEARGMDCDDGDPDVWPGNLEVDGNHLDDDCDGWIDDLLIQRRRADWWEWDVAEELGATTWEVFDFETAVDGDSAAEFYVDQGLFFESDGSVVVRDDVYSALPVDALGVKVVAGVLSNDTTLVFEEEIDALGL